MNSYQITKTTAMDIALAWREIESSEALLEKIHADLAKGEPPDIRDVFGRQAGGLTLGIPSGENGRTLHNVPWSLCIPIIEANIAQHRAKIAALTEKVRIEMGAAVTPDAEESSPTGDLVDALVDMVHAVCHPDTGFAPSVRADSGMAYPCTALDIAEGKARRVLAKRNVVLP